MAALYDEKKMRRLNGENVDEEQNKKEEQPKETTIPSVSHTVPVGNSIQEEVQRAVQAASARPLASDAVQQMKAQQMQAQQQAVNDAQETQSLRQRIVSSVQQKYNDYVAEHGVEPPAEVVSNWMAGNRWAVAPAIREYVGKGTKIRTGGTYSDPNEATMSFLRNGYQTYQQGQQSAAMAARAFSPRNNGQLSVPEGTAIRDLGAIKVTDQDIKSLNAWMKEPLSPERDAAIATALGNMGIHLPNNGTLEQRLSAYVQNPSAYEGGELGEEEIKRRSDALADLLHYAGVTIDADGNYTLPHNPTVDEYMQRFQNFESKEKQEYERQKALLDRERRRKNLAGLAEVFGDMIKSTTGAKVLPHDLTKAYENLDAQQQKLYDNYRARTEAERLRLAKEKADADKLKAAADEAEKNRKWKEAQAEAEREWRAGEAELDRQLKRDLATLDDRYKRWVIRMTKGEQANLLRFYLDLGENGHAEFDAAEGESKYSQIYNEMKKSGKLPKALIPIDNYGDEKRPSASDLKVIVNMAVNDILNDDEVDPSIKSKIVKIALGKDVQFDDKRTAPDSSEDAAAAEESNTNNVMATIPQNDATRVDMTQRDANREILQPGNSNNQDRFIRNDSLAAVGRLQEQEDLRRLLGLDSISQGDSIPHAATDTTTATDWSKHFKKGK